MNSCAYLFCPEKNASRNLRPGCERFTSEPTGPIPELHIRARRFWFLCKRANTTRSPWPQPLHVHNQYYDIHGKGASILHDHQRGERDSKPDSASKRFSEDPTRPLSHVYPTCHSNDFRRVVWEVIFFYTGMLKIHTL